MSTISHFPETDALVAAIISAQRQHPGSLYTYGIPAHQPNRRVRCAVAQHELKIRRSIKPPRRRREWMHKCRPQDQEWWFYWEVPDAPAFGSWVWLGLHQCEFSSTRHCEKFDDGLCGGRWGVFDVVEHYLALPNWPSLMYFFNACNRMSDGPRAHARPPKGPIFKGISSLETRFDASHTRRDPCENAKRCACAARILWLQLTGVLHR
ncbi:hypothetical protein C8J57DRAFT_1500393 [Mycena rebaudengoi]|nr:hypothetical protein C8J57DRAFT_1500393 [Mycena rebaudengoi]